MEVLLLVLAVLFICSNSCYAYFKLAGPYEVTLEDFYECDDVGTHQMQYLVKIKKVNATTRLLQANVSFLPENNEKIGLKIAASKWTSGGWGKNAFNKEVEDYCAVWRDSLGEVFQEWCTALEMPIQCPFPLGSHSTPIGMPLIYQNLKMFPSLPYGRYKADLALYNGDTRIGCLAAVVNIDEIASTTMVR